MAETRGLATTVTLTLGAELENFDASGTGATKFNLSGNALDNRADCNDAATTPTGGAGNDTYVIGAGDTISKDVSGIDTAEADFTYSLVGQTTLENLTLTGDQAIYGTGNDVPMS